MATLEWTTPDHWALLHAIVLESIPLLSDMSFAEFAYVHFQRQGFTVFDGKRIVGFISFSDFIYPGLDAGVHVTIRKEYRGQWFRPDMLPPIFQFLKNTLALIRVSAWTIKGHTDQMERTILKMGFKFEQNLPSAFVRGDNRYDLKVYGRKL